MEHWNYYKSYFQLTCVCSPRPIAEDRGEYHIMTISAPKQITVIVAVILAILGLLPMFGLGFGIEAILSWGILAGFIVLLAGVLFEGV